MADFYGKNAQAVIDNKKIPPGQMNGHTKTHYDEVTFSKNVIGVSDVLHLGTIPRGAKVIGLKLKSPSLGTTGIFKLGYAPTDKDQSDKTGALGSGYDAGGQAVDVNKAILDMEPLAEERELIATFTEATTTADTLKLQALVEFVVD